MNIEKKKNLDENTAADLLANAVPIREISRVTGVNTVTLRAWERRYGLLKPLRTGKGHRLYSSDDIARVKEIQLWLGRGLAISKVSAILSNKNGADEALHIDSVWLELIQKTHAALNDFNRRSLERLWEEMLALYPAEMLADELLLPLLTVLTGEEPSQPARLAFFNHVVLEQFYRVQYRQRSTASGTKLLLLSSSANDTPLLPLILSYGLLINHFQSEFVGHLSQREAEICAQAIHAKAIIILGYETLDATQLHVDLQQWSEKDKRPIILVGRIASVYSATAPGNLPWVHACETQQHAIELVNSLFFHNER